MAGGIFSLTEYNSELQIMYLDKAASPNSNPDASQAISKGNGCSLDTCLKGEVVGRVLLNWPSV